MKCPLMPDKDYSIQLEKHLNGGDCLKEECAWWDKATDSCVISRISVAVEPLWAVLNEIQKKMPHEEQFRR